MPDMSDSLCHMKQSKEYAARMKRSERQRMRERGLILKQMWVHPQDWPSVTTLAEALRDKRESR